MQQGVTEMRQVCTLAFLLFLVSNHAGAGQFHCQPPTTSFIQSAHSDGDGEITDNIPDAYIGRAIDQVTLWMQVVGPWVDPDGIRIRFYNSECPPTVAYYLEFTIDWDEINLEPDSGLVWGGYRITANLPTSVAIWPDLSIGVSVVTSWGSSQWAGFYMTDVITGCEAYAGSDTNPRWTPMSQIWQAADLSYCLTEISTSLPATRSEELLSNWGGVKALFR